MSSLSIPAGTATKGGICELYNENIPRDLLSLAIGIIYTVAIYMDFKVLGALQSFPGTWRHFRRTNAQVEMMIGRRFVTQMFLLGMLLVAGFGMTAFLTSLWIFGLLSEKIRLAQDLKIVFRNRRRNRYRRGNRPLVGPTLFYAIGFMWLNFVLLIFIYGVLLDVFKKNWLQYALVNLLQLKFPLTPNLAEFEPLCYKTLNE